MPFGCALVLHAALIYQAAATRTTYLRPSAETIAWGGFLQGETFHFTDDAHAAIDEMLAAGLAVAVAA